MFAGLLVAIAVVGGLFLFRASTTATLRTSDSKVVIVYADNITQTVSTRETKVKDFLDAADIQINVGDVVEPSIETAIVEDNFHINVYRAKPVLLLDGDKKIRTLSAAFTPRSIAEQAGIQIYPEDILSTVTRDDILADGALGQIVEIDRALPVSINLYGNEVNVRTHTTTVGEVLKEKNIALAEGEVLSPSADTPLSAADKIFVTKFGTSVVTVEEDIAMETETVEDASLSFGTTAVRQAGSVGKKTVTYEVSLTNNIETSRRKLQEVVTKDPVKQIIARGKTVSIPTDKTAVMAAAGISESDYAYVNYIVSRESGWRYLASNASSGAYGLCQALPGTKMASAGSDWQTNPVTQLRWCTGYATGRYGGWSGAYSFWLSHSWW